MRLIFKGTPYLPEYRGWHDGRFVHVPAGGTIEVNDAAGAALLLKDFPGVFVVDIPEPVIDRQIKEPVRRKRI